MNERVLTMAKKNLRPANLDGWSISYRRIGNPTYAQMDAYGCGSASDFHRLPQRRRLLSCGRNKPLIDLASKEALRLQTWNIGDSAVQGCM